MTLHVRRRSDASRGRRRVEFRPHEQAGPQVHSPDEWASVVDSIGLRPAGETLDLQKNTGLIGPQGDGGADIYLT